MKEKGSCKNVRQRVKMNDIGQDVCPTKEASLFLNVVRSFYDSQAKLQQI